MEPDTERSDQVVARVVAWHNRHPLAERITADQVHSVGVVSLPFAVQGAQVQALPVKAVLPQDATADSAAEAPTAIPAAATGPAPTPVAAEPAPALAEAAAGDESARTILDRALDSASAPPSGPEAAAKADRDPADADTPTGVDTVTAVNAATDAAPGPMSRVQWHVSGLPARLPRWHPRRWWQRLRGTGPYRALFTEDFIAPLRPSRVARWAALHGQAPWPLEPGAAQRMVMLDDTQRRPGDAAPELDLHLITAAIGIGDTRLRLLLAPGAGGAVLGQRRWSRQRLAMSAPLVLGLAVALGAGVHARWPSGAGAGAVTAAVAPAPVASAASAAARSASASASSAPLLAAAASAPASAPMPAPTVMVAAASAPPIMEPRASEHSPAAVAPQREPVEEILPPQAEPRRGRVDLPPLVPRLADTQRQALRQDARVLRQEPVHQVKAWALVTATLTDKRQSQRVAAQLHAVALLQPVPMRAELLPAGAGWRAVFWPFTSERDAEKVRLALADKGLRTEVLEF